MKHIRNVIAVGVCLGIVLLAVQHIFSIEEGRFLRGFWIAASAAVIIAVLINVLYNLSYQRRVKHFPALLEEGRAPQLIDEANAMLATAKGRALRNILTLNLAAGYMETGKYDTAIELLEGLSGEKFFGSVKLVHRLNLCIAYFHAKRPEQALALFHESEGIFAPYRGRAPYGGNIAELDVLAALCDGENGRAAELLSAAKTAWDSPRLQEDFAEIEAYLAQR